MSLSQEDINGIIGDCIGTIGLWPDCETAEPLADPKCMFFLLDPSQCMDGWYIEVTDVPETPPEQMEALQLELNPIQTEQLSIATRVREDVVTVFSMYESHDFPEGSSDTYVTLIGGERFALTINPYA